MLIIPLTAYQCCGLKPQSCDKTGLRPTKTGLGFGLGFVGCGLGLGLGLGLASLILVLELWSWSCSFGLIDKKTKILSNLV